MIPSIETMENAFNIKGKNIMITGGNRGIGKGIAAAMAQSGANIAILSRDEASSRRTIEELAHMEEPIDGIRAMCQKWKPQRKPYPIWSKIIRPLMCSLTTPVSADSLTCWMRMKA